MKKKFNGLSRVEAENPTWSSPFIDIKVSTKPSTYRLKKKKSPFVMDFPKMSWERPIEEILLEFCNHMARTMRSSESYNRETGWFADNSLSERCGAAAMAYETVANRIKEEIRLKSSL